MVFNKHIDDRGLFQELFKDSETAEGFDIKQVSLCTIRPKQVRGGHWHRIGIEAFVVIEGEMILRQASIDLTSPNLPDVTETVMSLEKNTLMYNFPWQWHEVTSEEGCKFIILQNWEYDPAHPDTVKGWFEVDKNGTKRFYSER